MELFKLMKSKTYGKDASKFDPDKHYCVSTKYDGNCIMIHQNGTNTRWFTSDNKEFSLPYTLPRGNYVLIGEFMYGCQGKLGDRVHSAKLTTLRTDFAKGRLSTLDFDKVNIKLFDHFSDPTIPYKSRMLKNFSHPNISVASSVRMTGREALIYLKHKIAEGWEGLMLRDPEAPYEAGKRVHHSIKLKVRNTADLLCIGVEEGLGKCNGIGALVLQDKKGRIVKVGSGLDYSEEARNMEYVGKVVEIYYEQILATYIQPIFSCIREDKTKEDID